MTRIRTDAAAAPSVRYPAQTAGVAGRPISIVPYRVAADTATFALSRGSLPPGVALDPRTGALTGTTTSTGAFPIRVTLTGLEGRTMTVDVTLTVRGDRSGAY